VWNGDDEASGNRGAVLFIRLFTFLRFSFGGAVREEEASASALVLRAFAGDSSCRVDVLVLFCVPSFFYAFSTIRASETFRD
jgi:hypothetical protein